jgi:L-asparagine oxygenase
MSRFRSRRLQFIQMPEGTAKQLEAYARAAAVDPYRIEATAEFLHAAAVVQTLLPDSVRDALHRLRTDSADVAAVVLSSVLPGGIEVSPTPRCWQHAGDGRTNFAAETVLAGVMLAIGRPMAFASQQQGRLVQNIVPAKGDELAQASQGSLSFLQWHVEDAFTDLRPHCVGLLAVRESPERAGFTLLAFADDLALDERTTAALTRPNFVFVPDSAHRGRDGEFERSAVLQPAGSGYSIRYDPLFMAVAANAEDGAPALDALGHMIASCAVPLFLEAGDLLVFNNRRAVHARTPFHPTYNGRDRWLQRVSVRTTVDDVGPEWFVLP